MDGKRINASFIQKEIEQALEEKRFPLPVSSPLPVRQVEKRSPARTPGTEMTQKVLIKNSNSTVFRSKPIHQILRPKEKKPDLVNNQCVVYHFKCDQCDADYVGFTTRHLHQRIQEHWYSAIGKHLIN